MSFHALIGLLTVSLGLAVASSQAELSGSPIVVCGQHVPAENCAAGKDIVTWALQRSGAGVEGWRWVLVAREDWEALASFYKVPARVPGFTNLPTRTTYLEDVIYALNVREVSDRFPDMGRLAGSARVEWLVTHELGHVICGVRDERAADVAASRLRLRVKEPCRGLR
jgi:hypothetical protein